MERHLATIGFCSKCFSPMAKDDDGTLVFVKAPSEKDGSPVAVRGYRCAQCENNVFLCNAWQDDEGHLFRREEGGACIRCFVENGGKLEFVEPKPDIMALTRF